MSYLNDRESIRLYKALQKSGLLGTICPRCGGKMREEEAENALSRYHDIYICSECGLEEACDGLAELKLPSAWYIAEILKKADSYLDEAEEDSPFHTLPIFCMAMVTDENIDDIMTTALEGGISYWCSKAETVGPYLGEYASDQISRGGMLLLHDSEEPKIYELTLDKFLKGLRLYLKDFPCLVTEDGLDTGDIDAEGADCIVQLSLFGEVVYG